MGADAHGCTSVTRFGTNFDPCPSAGNSTQPSPPFFCVVAQPKKKFVPRGDLCAWEERDDAPSLVDSPNQWTPRNDILWYILIYIYIHIMIYFDILWWMVLPNRLQDSLPGLQRTLRGGGSSGWLETEWFRRLPMVFFFGEKVGF